MKKNRHRLRPAIDALEDRRVLSTFGNAWPSGNITLSFAPDGTRDGLSASNLSQALSPLNTNGDDWQVQLLKAAQTWADAADINISLASDGGQDLGTQGSIQGDSRFGDIRIGSVPQSSSTLALAQPFQYAAGSWSGDVNLNANAHFGINSSTSPDLYTVALHELGHSLGLDDNTDTTSAMFDSYQGPRAGISTADAAAVKALYGSRGVDKYDGTATNDTFATATTLAPDKAIKGFSPLKAKADISSMADADFYKFIPSVGTLATSFQLKTAGISLLKGKLSVFDANRNVLAAVASVDPRNGSLSVQLPGLVAGKSYYVEVQGDGVDAFGMGSYELNVTTDALSTTGDTSANFFGSYPVTNGLVNSNPNTYSTCATAYSLGALPKDGGLNIDYAIPGSLTTTGSTNVYSFKSPASYATGATGTLTVIVWGLDLNAVDTRVTLYDARQNPVAANVLVHEGGSSILQVPNAVANATYYARVAAYAPTGTHSTGNYFFAVSFGVVVDGQQVLGSGTVYQAPGATTPVPMTITAVHDDLFHLVLSTTNGGVSAAGSVQVKITDASGRVVATLVAQANQQQSLEIWLAAGNYQVTVSAVAVTGTATTPVPLNWSLATEDLSDPLRVYSSTSTGTTPTR